MKKIILVWHIILGVFLLMLVVPVEDAESAIITHSFEGEIATIQQGGSGFAFDGSVAVGISVIGSFSYDTSTVITSSFDAFRVDYFPDTSSLFLANIGNYMFTSEYRIRVTNDLPQPADAFTLEKTGNATFTNGIDTISDLLWSLNLFDPNSNAFSSTDLPLVLPSLDAFRDKFINLQVPRNSPSTPDTATLVIRLNSLSSQMTTAAVPEPTTLALFATGLASLGFMMRRRRRSMQLKAA